MSHHLIVPAALWIPLRVVKLNLDIGGGRIIGDNGHVAFGRALRATAETLTTLKLGMSYLSLHDPELVKFCQAGLSHLRGVKSLSLDLSSNRLTNAGVDTLQHSLGPMVKHMELILSFNVDVTYLHLHTVKSLHTATLQLSGMSMIDIRIPDQVMHLSVDLRAVIQRQPFNDTNPMLNAPIRLAGIELIRRMILFLDHNNALPILQQITPPAPDMTLELELEMSLYPPVDAMHRVFDLVAQHGLLGTLASLRFAFLSRSVCPLLDPLPRTLTAASTCLSRLYIQLPFNVVPTLVLSILMVVARDLCHLTHFHFVMDGTASHVDVHTIAPCTEFARKGRILRDVQLDFNRTRLTDMAVALLLNTAVKRHQLDRLNRTNLKFEGVSAGKYTLQVLYTHMACIGCSFHFYPPMSDALAQIQNLCYPV